MPENPPLNRYGVKLTSGKVFWILADSVRVEGGMVLFLDGTRVVAGFSVAHVNHFALPEAFAE